MFGKTNIKILNKETPLLQGQLKDYTTQTYLGKYLRVNPKDMSQGSLYIGSTGGFRGISFIPLPNGAKKIKVYNVKGTGNNNFREAAFIVTKSTANTKAELNGFNIIAMVPAAGTTADVIEANIPAGYNYLLYPHNNYPNTSEPPYQNCDFEIY